MRIVSLTIPKPTLNNEEEIQNISLTIKSRSNGMQIIDSWPHAFPRYKYDLEDKLEISIYYKLKSSSNKIGSDEINLHSVIYFPCILLDEIDKRGKKQWILGLDKFNDNNTNTLLVKDTSIEYSLKQIKIMEEKAKRSFKISKIYLIFYSCNKTVLNIEEQLNSSYTINHACDLSLSPEANAEDRNFNENEISKSFRQNENFDKSKTNFGIRPEDSVSRISARTSNSNTISRTNLIKQNLTENSDNLSDAIEMINKYRKSRSKGSLNNIISIDHGNDHSIHQNYKSISINSNKQSSNSKIVSNLDNFKVIDRDQVSNTLSKLNEKDYKNTTTATIDAASIISKAISTNTKKYLEKKKVQERLLTLQYYFSIWRQATRKERNIKKSKKTVKITSGLINLLRIFEKNQRFKEMMFIKALRFNSFEKEMKKKELYFEQITNEKNILAEKLNTLILDNCEKFQKINQNILMKEKDIFELRKKLEYYDNKNSELKDEMEMITNENKKLIGQIKELNEYIQDQEKLIESDKVKNNKERIEMEIIIDRRKKEYSRQLEEIHYLSSEVNDLKNRNLSLMSENEEFNKKLITLEEEKMNIINEFNQSLLEKSKENEELYMENIRFKEDNELLLKNNNRLADENNNYIKICEELKNEKSSLMGSVYDLINQIENEKIERIQELENSRILFQSINNGGSFNYNSHKQVVNLYNVEELGVELEQDLTLEDLKDTINKGKDIDIEKKNEMRRRSEIIVGENCIEIIGEEEVSDSSDSNNNNNNNNESGIKKELWNLREREKTMMGIGMISGIRSFGNNNQLVKLNSIEIKGKSKLVKRAIREVRLEFYDEEYENIKLKNEQIMDLSERVRLLTNEMNKLKDKEKEEEKDYNSNEEVIELNLDDTERIIGSATEMFKLALRNIKMNKNKNHNNSNINNLFGGLENERPKSSTFGLDQDEMESDVDESKDENKDGVVINNNNKKEDIEVNDSKMLMIVPSEFSFSSNYCDRKSDLPLLTSKSPSEVIKKVIDDNLGNNYHQYNNTVENSNTNNNGTGNNKIITNINESNNFGGNMFKLGYDKIVSSISSALTSTSTTSGSVAGLVTGQGSVSESVTGSGSSVSRLGSSMLIKGNEISYSQMTKNNPIILQFPIVRSSSQSPAVLSRSNSMRYSNNNNNGNNNIGGYYYQYNTGEKLYKINNIDSNFGIEENSYQKRYSSLPRQNIRTVPPPFFPRN
ncbi:uncharacterized protein ELE39_001897 [Cryptosporidium sp. chipmunk genotype I]|uniref:uncharacterized protein n=1 Tax=Cryptosporidium sp. chipmunk genotype I TaxID=1280935 RepID=UPI00351A3225|nr:hypothetical protein ELE39_001897 [Cryptosporidium sp. chipmunk genotype I]